MCTVPTLPPSNAVTHERWRQQTTTHIAAVSSSIHDSIWLGGAHLPHPPRGLQLTEIRWFPMAQPFTRHSVRLSVDHRIKQ